VEHETSRLWRVICHLGEGELHRLAEAGDDRAYAELIRRDPKARAKDLPGVRQ
jgi:hypothetical protein